MDSCPGRGRGRWRQISIRRHVPRAMKASRPAPVLGPRIRKHDLRLPVVLQPTPSSASPYAAAVPVTHRTALLTLRTLGVLAAVSAVIWTSPIPPAAAESLPTGPWVSLPDANNSGAAITDVTAGSFPRPGVTVASQLDAEVAQLCTAAWPVASTENDVAFLTAGHCQTTAGAPLWMYTSSDKSTRKLLMPLQDVDYAIDDDGIARDSAVFFLPRSSREYSAQLAPGVKLRGVLSVREVQELPPGTPLCMNGSRSGLTCGPLIRAGSSEIEWESLAVKGDSGAPVFVVDEQGQAMAVGMVSHGPTDTKNFVTYLRPVLSKYGLRVIIEEDV